MRIKASLVLTVELNGTVLTLSSLGGSRWAVLGFWRDQDSFRMPGNSLQALQLGLTLFGGLMTELELTCSHGSLFMSDLIEFLKYSSS